MGRSNYTVNTYSFIFSSPAEECLERLSDAGFDRFELMMYPGHVWPPDRDLDQRRRLKQLMERRNLTLSSLNQPQVDINLAGATQEMRAYSRALVLQTVELAGELGVPAVLIGPGKVNPLLPSPRAEVMGRFYESLDVLVPAARRAGTQILIENMPHSFLPRADEMIAAIDAYGSDEVGVTYDVANASFVGEAIDTGMKRCRDRIRVIHVSDTTRDVFKHDPIGFGDIDFGGVINTICDVAWRGKPVLEIIGRTADPIREIVECTERLDAMGWSDRLGGPE